MVSVLGVAVGADLLSGGLLFVVKFESLCVEKVILLLL